MENESGSIIMPDFGKLGMQKTYVGDGRFLSTVRSHQEAWVEVDGVKTELDPRLDLRNHSATGFSWGYQGSGPAQLALAILADASNDKIALQRYQEFKQEYIATLSQNRGFRIPIAVVHKFLERKEQTTEESEYGEIG